MSLGQGADLCRVGRGEVDFPARSLGLTVVEGGSTVSMSETDSVSVISEASSATSEWGMHCYIV